MVRAMNHGVAVHTGTATGILRRVRPAKPALIARSHGAIRGLAVVRAVVTFRAHKRCAGFQQRRDVGAVRLMAVGAILRYRLMLPQERPALFSVAGKAGLVQGVPFEQFRPGRAMWVVAVGAGILPAASGCVEI